MYADCDVSEDEITPNPRAYPTFPSLSFNLDTPNACKVTHTPNISYTVSTDVSSCNTTTVSQSSLQDCSVVPMPRGSDEKQTNSYFNFSSLALYRQTVAANINEMRRKFTTDLTDDEERRGFRLNKYPDPRYLGFAPSPNDKRSYLTAMPIATFKSPARVGCYLPVSTGQKVVLFTFVLIVLLMSAAGAYCFRSMIVGDIVIRFR
eukprot:gb/GEZJ01003377.1/.p1 GENE.gb/GEZJ01003377.1/~~gb/GEZJ01003377.1/.p1  ORF type:complete len:205 (-),score=20.61 gb/GEZJ01003377.1/:2093-2707(-)